jgi:hypothetical protein
MENLDAIKDLLIVLNDMNRLMAEMVRILRGIEDAIINENVNDSHPADWEQ